MPTTIIVTDYNCIHILNLIKGAVCNIWGKLAEMQHNIYFITVYSSENKS